MPRLDPKYVRRPKESAAPAEGGTPVEFVNDGVVETIFPAMAGPAEPETVPAPAPEAAPDIPGPTGDPAPDPAGGGQFEALRQENERLAAELNRERQIRAADEAARAAAIRDVEYQKYVAPESLDGLEFESLDAADAKKLHGHFAGAMDFIKKKVDSMDKTLAEQSALQAKAVRNQRISDVWSKLREQVPGVDKFMKSPEFEKYLNTPFYPGGDEPLRNFMSREHERGNAEFVVAKVKEFVDGRPSLAAVTRVAAGGSELSMRGETPAEPDEMRELKKKMRNREILPDEFKRRMGELSKRQAAAGSV
jgi:hypothetical protein